MRLRCYSCGKSVSNELPDDTVVRAALECPECIEKKSAMEPIRKVIISSESIGDILYMIGERSGMAPLEYVGALVASVYGIGQTLPDMEKGYVLNMVDKGREIFLIKCNIVEDKKGTVQ